MPVFRRTSWTSSRRSFPFAAASTFSPSTSMEPKDGSSRKLMHRNNVLLPEPLRPMIHTSSRGATSTEICFSTCKRPKYLSRLEIRTMGAILSVSSGETAFDDALHIGQDNCHNPVKDGSNDQGFQVVKLSSTNSCGAPHHFVNKTRCRNKSGVLGHGNKVIANRRNGKP